MKILHTIETSGPGGAENFLIRTALALRDEYEPLVLLIKPGWLQKRLLDLDLPVIVQGLRRSLDPAWLINIARLIKRENVEVIHSHEFAMNIHMSLLARLLKINHVATVHGKKYYGEKAVRRLAYRLISHYSTIVAVSADVKSYLVDTVGIQSDRVWVIPNGIEVDEYRRQTLAKSQEKAELGCGPDDYLVCAIGNLYEIKGHRYLVSAIGEVYEKYKNVRLVIAGRGDEYDSLKSQIADLGLEDTVALLGFRDDVNSILLASDLFVMPSLSEGLPLSLLEAMAAKIPVIVTAVGGMPQVIENGKTGCVVPARDSSALAAAIDKLIGGPELASGLAAAAYDEVLSKYSMRAMLESYKKLYAGDFKRALT